MKSRIGLCLVSLLVGANFAFAEYVAEPVERLEQIAEHQIEGVSTSLKSKGKPCFLQVRKSKVQGYHFYSVSLTTQLDLLKRDSINTFFVTVSVQENIARNTQATLYLKTLGGLGGEGTQLVVKYDDRGKVVKAAAKNFSIFNFGIPASVLSCNFE